MKIFKPTTLAALPLLLAACSTGPSAPPAAQVTPVNATVQLGRISEKTFLTRVDVADAGGYPGYSGYGVGVGAGGGSWGGGSGMGVGFAVDLTRLLNRGQQPVQQMDIFQYKVAITDGTTVVANGPAAPGLEPGDCVRLIYAAAQRDPQIAPSNEC
jgi:hypothetical protein